MYVCSILLHRMLASRITFAVCHMHLSSARRNKCHDSGDTHSFRSHVRTHTHSFILGQHIATRLIRLESYLISTVRGTCTDFSVRIIHSGRHDIRHSHVPHITHAPNHSATKPATRTEQTPKVDDVSNLRIQTYANKSLRIFVAFNVLNVPFTIFPVTPSI